MKENKFHLMNTIMELYETTVLSYMNDTDKCLIFNNFKE
jgi:hypothetical protein